MSVSSATLCLTCNEQARELGDGGMMGTPDATAKKDYNEDWGVTTYSFGWIYKGLDAISLVPGEVEAYRQFLEKHAAHELFLGNDHMDESEIPERDVENTTSFMPALDGFVAGTFELSCPAKDAKVQTSFDAERYKPFEDRQLSSDEIECFLKHLTAPEVFDSITRTSPSVEPYEDLGPIVQFVQSHQGEAIHVRLLPKA